MASLCIGLFELTLRLRAHEGMRMQSLGALAKSSLASASSVAELASCCQVWRGVDSSTMAPPPGLQVQMLFLGTHPRAPQTTR